jgi:dTDP-4-amino-4,6-dideoxygalactose transaminase
MGKVHQIVAERLRLGRRYNDLLTHEDRIETPFVPEGFQHVYQSYNVRLRTDRTQEDVMKAMMDLGIATRRIFATHNQPAFADNGPVPYLPVTDEAASRTILLPMFVGLTDDEQDEVVAGLAKCL